MEFRLVRVCFSRSQNARMGAARAAAQALEASGGRRPRDSKSPKEILFTALLLRNLN